MTITQHSLEKSAHLAYLNINTTESEKLKEIVSFVLDLADQLRAVDTVGIEPLAHPFSVHQPLRTDTITEANCIAELEAIAPLFKDNLFIVPKVIESDK